MCQLHPGVGPYLSRLTQSCWGSVSIRSTRCTITMMWGPARVRGPAGSGCGRTLEEWGLHGHDCFRHDRSDGFRTVRRWAQLAAELAARPHVIPSRVLRARGMGTWAVLGKAMSKRGLWEEMATLVRTMPFSP